MSKRYELEDMDAFIEMVYGEGWTDGLPVFPPTEKNVRAAIDYAGRDPEEVIGVVASGEGVATVEKIAINSVMAGCRPEYLPIVITAVEAMLDPSFELMRVQATTAGPAPLAIISGPVVKKLDFNYGEGVFTGSGHRANATIGRAIRLILWNVGMGRPGKLSHATMGQPGRWSYVVAERPAADGNPWTPIHVSNGLEPEDSAVSMFPVGFHDEFWAGTGAQSIENVLHVTTDSICHLGHFQGACQKLLVLNPQFARVFDDSGWSKERLRDELLERCRRPLRDIKRTGGLSVTHAYHWTKLVSGEDDDELVPSMVGPNHLQIMVSGGWAPPCSQCVAIHSMHGEMVTRKINWSWD